MPRRTEEQKRLTRQKRSAAKRNYWALRAQTSSSSAPPSSDATLPTSSPPRLTPPTSNTERSSQDIDASLQRVQQQFGIAALQLQPKASSSADSGASLGALYYQFGLPQQQPAHQDPPPPYRPRTPSPRPQQSTMQSMQNTPVHLPHRTPRTEQRAASRVAQEEEMQTPTRRRQPMLDLELQEERAIQQHRLQSAEQEHREEREYQERLDEREVEHQQLLVEQAQHLIQQALQASERREQRTREQQERRERRAQEDRDAERLLQEQRQRYVERVEHREQEAQLSSRANIVQDRDESPPESSNENVTHEENTRANSVQREVPNLHGFESESDQDHSQDEQDDQVDVQDEQDDEQFTHRLPYYYTVVLCSTNWTPSFLCGGSAISSIPVDADIRHILRRMDQLCAHCGAKHWAEERRKASSITSPKFGCCEDGEVALPLHQDYPPELHKLIAETFVHNDGSVRRTPDCVEVHRSIRHLNNAFSFCSLGANIDQRLANATGGAYTFRLQGNLYHRLPNLIAEEGQKPAFAQLYIFDGDDEQLQRRGEAFTGLSSLVLRTIQTVLHRTNPFVRNFRNNAQRIQHDRSVNLHLNLVDDQGQDPRRYNRPTVSEVAAIMPNINAPTNGRQIVMQNLIGGLQFISEYLPIYQPLRYPFLFPFGERGWGKNILRKSMPFIAGDSLRADAPSADEGYDDQADIDQQESDAEYPQQRRRGRGKGGSRRVSQMNFFNFHLQVRSPISSILLAGRLFHEWLVDAFAALESNRLNFLRMNQSSLRSEALNGLVDAVNLNDNVTAGDVGVPVMLPASHMGSPRQMHNAYLDAMAIARHFGAPEFFITMTCNPRWIEITRELQHGQEAQDRPDLANRVFKLKLKVLLHELLQVGVLGKVIAHCYTIEFQKRGLPHVHILLTMAAESRVQNAEQLDTLIRADLPVQAEEPLLFDVVTRFMLHAPCGTANPRANCMRDRKCRFNFPFDFRDDTVMPEDGYPMHAKPDNGIRYKKSRSGYEYSSRDIAPYSKYLLLRLNAHINVQYVAGFGSIKYAFKYIFKGPDMSTAQVSAPGAAQTAQLGTTVGVRDEIAQYLDSRYVAANEAGWRISSEKTHDRSPAVERLAVHLENQQTITLTDGAVRDAINNEKKLRSTLTEYFAMNLQHEAMAARGQAPEPDSRSIKYQDFPQHFTWQKSEKRWRLRKRGFALGRMSYVPPTKGELFYLRLLLTSFSGQTSHRNAATFEGVQYPSYQATCLAAGLLLNDQEFEDVLREASVSQLGHQLRELFCTILLSCAPQNPLALWELFRVQLSDDCSYKLRNSFGVHAPTEQDTSDLALCYIRNSLQRRFHELHEYCLPMPGRDFLNGTIETRNQLLLAERSYDTDSEQVFFESSLPQLNADQRTAFDILCTAVSEQQGGMFFVDGPGGTGKTFLQKVVLAKLRSEGKIALAVATTGIAATLLPGGSTAHTRFKIPVEIDETTSVRIPKQSHLAELIESCSLVFWDEAVMAHRHAIEAAERGFRDIRGNDLPFGGAVMCFCGDFRQTLPIVKKGSRPQIINACLKKSILWTRITTLPLTINMRLHRPGMDELERQSVAAFGRKLLQVGERTGQDGTIYWNTSDIVLGNKQEVLAATIFPNISRHLPSHVHLTGSAILAPTNNRVAEINALLLNSLRGSTGKSWSIDKVKLDESATSWPPEMLHSIVAANLPPHELTLKIGCPVILLRNLDPTHGLCNGTRMRVVHIGRRLLQCKILGGSFDGAFSQLPRIPLESSLGSEGVAFTRHQWPVKVAFAITINKSQGQSLDNVGLILDPEVFSHGQLYVALSRVTNPTGIRMVVPCTDKAARRGHLKNVVYPEVFQM